MSVQNEQPSGAINNEELYWQSIRNNTVQAEEHPNMMYADWTASGRLYKPIEDRLSFLAGGLMANTHTEDSFTGREMSRWLHEATNKIKAHVNASESDVFLSVGSGMTGALAKLIRILGWWAHESHIDLIKSQQTDKPLVYITHREHHSNQTMWLESLVELRIIPALEGDEIDLQWLEQDLIKESDRKIKVASVTGASNVTGIFTPYRKIAKLMHENSGLCFVDFAASAPYVEIDMHPNDSEYLDAIYFSPHKFLGGPGSNGALIFNNKLYNNAVPEQPGGGTVLWTNPWGEHKFVTDIEQRESGGTPGILQTIKTAMAIQLKEEMGVERIAQREKMLNEQFMARLAKIENLTVLSNNHKDRLSIFSIIFKNLDYKLAVKALSDHFGVECRGGCACAGTYGHHLLNIDQCMSNAITDQLDDEHQDLKPGWVRVSLHPSMSIEQVEQVAEAIDAVANGGFDPKTTVSRASADLWTAFS